MTGTDNKALWNSVFRTDPAHVKPIVGKPYKGSSPGPYWLISRATDMFGPCGLGWGFEILRERIVDGAPGTKVHIACIKLWYIWGGKRGEIEHIGETVFCGTNKNGPFTDEEAPKKSITDALGKALSMLGFAGDIFMGRYDDSKYVSALTEELRQEAVPAASVDDSVAAYIRHSLKTISTFDNAAALKTWWTGQRESDMRAALDIINGTPRYATLFTAFVARGHAILAPAKEAAE